MVTTKALTRSGSNERRRSPRSVLKGCVASGLCFVPALYLLGVVAFALRNASDYATATPQALRYVLIPALLAFLFSMMGLRGSRVARVNLGGAACGILALLFLNEWHLEARYVSAVTKLLSAPEPETKMLGNENPGIPSARTIKNLNYQIGTRHLADAVLGGVPNSMVGLCREGVGTISYRADRYGFRNPDAAFDHRPNLALIGDSFVEGICLPDGEDLAGQIRHRETSLQSFGTRGAGPLFELAMLGRFGSLTRPHWTVLVFYEGNDWEDMDRELRTPWLAEALVDNARFGDAATPPETAARVRSQIERWNAVGRPLSAGMLRKTHVIRNFLALHQTWTQLGLGYPKAAQPIPQYALLLARAKELVARWDGHLALLYIPQTSRFVGLLPDGFVYDQVRDKVSNAAAANAVPLVDLTPAFSGQTDPIALYSNGHLSERGAGLAADILIRNLDALDKDRHAS